jgi:bifunctional non-homologous end joining protein LigD
MQPETISLYYRSGSSDKVYHVQLVPAEGGLFKVEFQYGRRGSTLQSGTKTSLPVSYDRARSIYDKLVAEKKGKGYTEAAAGTPFQGSEKAGQLSGLMPQLLNPVEEDRVRDLIQDPDWMAQEKKDGIRLMARSKDRVVSGSNRKGITISIPVAVEGVIADLAERLVLDGELVGDVYWAFDLLEIGDEDLRLCGAEARYHRLLKLVGNLPEDGAVRIVPCVPSTFLKQELFEKLRSQRAEGVVFKKKASPYTPGRPNSGGDQVKFKFTETVTCLVDGANDSRRSVRLLVASGSDSISVGNVTIPLNATIPPAGSLIEVCYFPWPLVMPRCRVIPPGNR